jgi:glycosyltransferase involved in cell wall biosynthesis
MEGIPKVLLEAAACGVPIISSNKPGCRDVIGRSDPNCLVAVRNVNDLCDKIVNLLGQPERRSEISIYNAKRADKMYRVEHVVESFINFNASLFKFRSKCERQKGGIGYV